LLALLALSEGSDFFVYNPADTAFILDLLRKLDDPDTVLFQRALRLSILTGGTAISSPAPSAAEYFATRTCVFCAAGEHDLVFRHGLGITIYEVTEVLPSVPSEPSLPPSCSGAAACHSLTNVYVSHSPNDALEAALDELESAISGSDAFVPFTPPPPRPMISAAHSLLCDLGLIGGSGMERRVPPALAEAIELLDATPVAHPVFAFVLAVNDGCAAVFERLMRDLQPIETPVCAFNFEPATLDGSFAGLAARSGFIVLLNPAGVVNTHCSELAGFDIVITIAPAGDEAWIARALCRDPAIFGDHEVAPCPVVVPGARLGAFIAMFAFLFFATPGRSKGGATRVKGPDQFVGGFYGRCKQIAQIFERAEAGKAAVLWGARLCGLAPP
jgi:hypothetical protein